MSARLALLAGLLLAASPAAAGDGRVPPVDNATVSKECGSCHMAFQPTFLPARSWTQMTARLADHFGEDVSLPAETVDIIRRYLTGHAGDVATNGVARKYMRWVAPDGLPQRITENPAFMREHRFPESVWRDPKVVTRSNCLACHASAQDGRYE